MDISEACLAVAVLTRATKIRLKSLLSLVPCGLKPEPSPGGPRIRARVHVAYAAAPGGAQREPKAELITLCFCPLLCDSRPPPCGSFPQPPENHHIIALWRSNAVVQPPEMQDRAGSSALAFLLGLVLIRPSSSSQLNGMERERKTFKNSI